MVNEWLIFRRPVVRFRHSHPLDTGAGANVGIEKTTSNSLIIQWNF